MFLIIFVIDIVYVWNSPTSNAPNPAGQTLFSDSNNNIGVGTLYPGAKLEVYSTSSDSVLKLSRQSATSTLFNLGIDSALVINNNNSDVLTLKSGNVGIGTISQTSRFEVRAPTTGDYNTVLRGRSNNGVNYIDFNIQNDGTANFGGNFTNFIIGTTLDVNGYTAANDVWLKNVNRWASQGMSLNQNICQWVDASDCCSDCWDGPAICPQGMYVAGIRSYTGDGSCGRVSTVSAYCCQP